MTATQSQLKAQQESAAVAAHQQQQQQPPPQLEGQHKQLQQQPQLQPKRCSSGDGSINSTAAARAVAAAEEAAAGRHKLAQLEGALRQASADYVLILAELSKIRGQGAARQAALEDALAGRAAAQAEAARWEL